MTESEASSSSSEDTSPTPKKSGGCGKFLLIAGGIGLLTMVLCCGAAAWFAPSIIPKVATNPAEVTAIGKQILDLDIPKEFQPETAISMDNFAMIMKMATYKYQGNAGDLIIGNVQIKMGDPRQQPDFQKGGQTRDLQMGDTVVRELIVRGEKVPFRFSEAVETTSKKDFHVVEGELRSGGVTTFLKLVLEAGVYNEEEAIEMIQSIR